MQALSTPNRPSRGLAPARFKYVYQPSRVRVPRWVAKVWAWF
jgi:hypothetical protein